MSNYLEKIKNNKIIAVILIIGIVLMLIPSGHRETKKKEATEDYAVCLEEDLEEILSLIEGAGKVEVMVTLEDKGEVFPVTDVNGNGENIRENTVTVSGEALVARESYPKVRGVTVISKGAGISRVKADISEATRALTGAELHNIKVFKMRD